MTISEQVAPFVRAFRTAPGISDEPEWLCAHRDASIRHFAATGFPTRSAESWRFTDLRPLTASPILPAPDAVPNASERALADPPPSDPPPSELSVPTHRIILVNGRFIPRLSRIGALPPGVWLGSTADTVKARPGLIAAAFDASEIVGSQPFAALNAAFFADGFVLALEPGAVLETPIEVIHLGRTDTPVAFHLRNAIIAGSGSRATVIESTEGSGPGWTNAVTAITVDADASLRHIRIQNDGSEAIHTALTRATLARGARYENFALTLGARLSRQDIQVALSGEGASVALNGAYLLRGEQEATFAPHVDHQAPGCRTDEVLKGVMQDHAHGVFLGTIAVRPGADQTDARQLNRNLLLSPWAHVDTKPELEILADDVKCSHGATVGSLDEAALFYLQARGLDETTARHMLIEAFAADVIDTAALGDILSAPLRRHLRDWLGQVGGAA
ncbi:MAG: Fe-S cluster assembly protein SufD [Azospirillaceae bacterium]|nr:Fe-S cluster assembly protein SufD [Azospirillaceae bacterium]